MYLYNLTENEILSFILIMVRISAFYFAFPMFDQGAVPGPTKILLALLTSMVLFPVIGATPQRFIIELMAWYTLKEMFIGLIIAYIARFFFFVLNISGEIITAAIGLSSSQIFNPLMGGNSLILEKFQLFIGTLFFLAVNGHHIFIRGLVESFNLIPIKEQTLNPLAFQDMVLFAEKIIMIGVQLSAPIMGTILFLNIGMGIIGRAVPQVNVLVTSWALNILVGMGILIAMIPLMIGNIRVTLDVVTNYLFNFMKAV